MNSGYFQTNFYRYAKTGSCHHHCSGFFLCLFRKSESFGLEWNNCVTQNNLDLNCIDLVYGNTFFCYLCMERHKLSLFP